MNDLQKLQHIAKHFTILYVDDNAALLNKAAKLLRKFFHQVDIAYNGEEALEKCKNNLYPLVITDIKMPKMNGITFAKELKKLNPQTKVIIISAFDDKEYLKKGIELGLFRFLTKPVDVNELIETLLQALLEIQTKQKEKFFQKQLQNMINYQDSMILMLDDEKAIMANKIFLDFFSIATIDEFQKKYNDICTQFIQNQKECLEELQSNEEKLFQIQLKNIHGEKRDFLVKYRTIDEHENYAILSFDDITQLNVAEDVQNDNTRLFNLIHAIYRNDAQIEICNFYKGLNITNNASITAIKEPSLIIKTSYTQQKAMQNEKRTFLCSKALPYVIESTSIPKIDLTTQNSILESLSFVKTSPIDRKTVRVEPQENFAATLSIQGYSYSEGITIQDISIDAVRLKLLTLPAGLKIDSTIKIILHLKIQQEDFEIQAEAKLYKKEDLENCFYIVCLFKNIDKQKLIKYITKRQITIIREFKGLENAK